MPRIGNLVIGPEYGTYDNGAFQICSTLNTQWQDARAMEQAFTSAAAGVLKPGERMLAPIEVSAPSVGFETEMQISKSMKDYLPMLLVGILIFYIVFKD